MRSSHTAGAVCARFDDPNLVSHAGLVPVMRLAERVGLPELADRLMRIPGSTGANAGAKVCSIVAGMAAGADSIDDLGLLRHGAMSRLFTGIRAPSTLGTFLRGTCMGDVASLQAVARRTLTGLAGQVPLLPGAGELAFLDIDSKTLQVYGGAKQGARTRYTGVRGLDYQITTLSTPAAAPVILGSRLRGGNAASGRGAASLIAASLSTARVAGATGALIVRGDSKFFQAKVIGKVRAAGARFSITVPNNAGIRQAISELADHGRWTAIRYPRAIYDTDTDTWISEAEIAETSYTAFTNATQHQGLKVTARLIVRRVRTSDHDEQGELLPAHRYHAIFTDSESGLLTAEAQHRDHAIVEQVFADLTDSALAHFPSGKFAANAFWLTAATIAHNLTRAAACLAGGQHAKARTGTLRRHIIGVAARISHSARVLTLHLPEAWPWQHAWQKLFTAAHPRPSPAPTAS
jgi:hypothetical protein